MTERAFSKRTFAEAKKIFIQEVQERLPEAQASLETLLHQGYNQVACTTLYKFAHTLKGSGRTVGVWDIAEPASEMEIALNLVKDYNVEFGKGMESFLLQRMNEIIDTLNQLENINNLKFGVGKKLQKRKILVVDDDYAITDLLEKSLVREGFAVIICHNTLEAEDYLEREQPDLIVLDIILPALNGIEFCRRIRSNSRFKLVPIIFLTVKSKLQDKLAGFATGADDYLCKPIPVEELVARIDAILNRIELSEDLIFQDDLTRAFNRRYLLRRLDEEVIQSKLEDKEFSLAIVDIDYFKNVNDSFGHVVGDEVLKTLVKRMQENLRATDVVCRYGGEEFIILLPETVQSTGVMVLERLRENIASETFSTTKSDKELSITVSIGVSSFPHDGNNPEKIIKEADAAMYQAKRAGRNMVVAASPPSYGQ
ncbi:MAG: diguanylate cyclase [Bacillota bacterium]